MRFETWISGLLLGANLLLGATPAVHASIVQDSSRKEVLLLGEYKLKRLGITRISCTISLPNDSLWIHINSKDGSDFKKVGWKTSEKEQKKLLTNRNLYEFKGILGSLKSVKTIELLIKGTFALKRKIAWVQVYQKVAQQKDSISRSNLAKRSKADSTALRKLSLHPPSKDSLAKWRSKFGRGGKDTIELAERKVVSHPGIRSILNPSGPSLLIPRSGKTLVLSYEDFQKKDTLVFSVLANSKPLKAIWLSKEKDTILNRVYDQTQFLDTIVVQTERKFNLHIKGHLSVKHQTVDVSVARIRPVPNDTFYLVTDSIYTTKSSTILDTVLFTVLDQTLSVPPIWDIEKEPFAQVEVQIPDTVGAGYVLQKVGYWLGIGRECLNNYLALEASVPPTWSKPGAPVALGAFLLGRPLALPRTGVTDVVSRFSKARIASNQFGRKIGIKASLPLFILTPVMLDSFCTKVFSLATNIPNYNFYACFQNSSSVNSYPIQLKIVGFYQKSTPGPSKSVFSKVNTFKVPLRR